MATIHELLDLIITTAQQLKGEAPTEESVPPVPNGERKWINGMSAPDDKGRVELELVERLVAEFGPAPAGYKIPRLWFVEGTPIAHLSAEAQGDHGQIVSGASENLNIAHSYKTEAGWWGKPARVKDTVLPNCLAWEGSLADLEAALRYRISILLNPNQSDPYTPKPNNGVLDTVAGYLKLQ